MSILKGELQTDNEDILYPHTSADVVFMEDGKSVDKQIKILEEQLGNMDTSWDSVTGKPPTFPPSTHKHTKAEITDFPASLPANGGNADTVDDKHASDFFPATGGNVNGQVNATGKVSAEFYDIKGSGGIGLVGNNGFSGKILRAEGADANGAVVALGGGGLTILGGGESAATYMTNLPDGGNFGTENAVVVADSSVVIRSNVQNGFTDANKYEFKNGDLYIGGVGLKASAMGMAIKPSNTVKRTLNVGNVSFGSSSQTSPYETAYKVILPTTEMLKNVSGGFRLIFNLKGVTRTNSNSASNNIYFYVYVMPVLSSHVLRENPTNGIQKFQKSSMDLAFGATLPKIGSYESHALSGMEHMQDSKRLTMAVGNNIDTNHTLTYTADFAVFGESPQFMIGAYYRADAGSTILSSSVSGNIQICYNEVV